MLLNQPMQTLVPTSSVTSQTSQCNMGISQTLYADDTPTVCTSHRFSSSLSLSFLPYRYSLDQPLIAPSFTMQQVNCNAVLVPSPVFTSPIMIPHNTFISHQSQSAYHTQPQASQHSVQPQQFFQVPHPQILNSPLLHQF